MRRSALHFTIPLVCALLGLMLVAAIGKADEKQLAATANVALPELAMAVMPASPLRMPPPAPVASPATRPAEPVEMLITSAPLKIDAPAPVLVPAAARPRTVMMEVTAYCPCKKCCGPKAQGITASGKRVNFNGGLFVAADKNVFDFHTQLKIPGYAKGQTVPVLDRGGAIKGNKLDVFFPSHSEAIQWGRQKLAVTVME